MIIYNKSLICMYYCTHTHARTQITLYISASILLAGLIDVDLWWSVSSYNMER